MKQGIAMAAGISALVSLVLILVASPAFTQQPAASIAVSQPTPGFRTADIGDKELRYKCEGQGTPAVIIEQGGGVSLETVFSWNPPVGWAVIAPKLAKVTKVCVYDRAGLGHSSKVTSPRTSFDAAADLQRLLTKVGVAPPYVIAGQSLGGMNARAFASAYPERIAGLILVDSSHPDQQERIARVLPPRSSDEPPVLARFRDAPDQTALGGEWYDFTANARLMTKARDLGDKPLIVLTRSPNAKPGGPLPKEWNDAIEPVWAELQRELARLSTNSKHIVATKAGHNIQLEEPDLVLDSILDIVSQVRKP
jgi:pimeloyl-ACP methyl ester carboxylesterase